MSLRKRVGIGTVDNWRNGLGGGILGSGGKNHTQPRGRPRTGNLRGGRGAFTGRLGGV